MCGIFFSLSARQHVLPHEKTVSWLQSRGPDEYNTQLVKLEQEQSCDGEVSTVTKTLYLTFVSSVLALRGDHIAKQPLVDIDSNSVLCWNGEAWKINGELIDGNDTELVFRELIAASRYNHDAGESEAEAESEGAQNSVTRLTSIISQITGPFSFVFFDGIHRRLYFSRDCLGRRSLLLGNDGSMELRICSIVDGLQETHFAEIETDGVRMIDLKDLWYEDQASHDKSKTSYSIKVLPWSHESGNGLFLKNPVAPMNKILPSTDPPALLVSSCCVTAAEDKLRQSVEIRVRNIPRLGNGSSGTDAKLGVLFSGGLDCTLLARLAHDVVPKDESIDLINVAFENPRVAAALKSKSEKNGEIHLPSIYESCPDRITGRAAHAELQKVCQGRIWRFVAVDIPYQEFTSHRDEIIQLMRPHNTEMDLSISGALYFASRGQGQIAVESDSSRTTAYKTTARVLLSGLGADELFGGYGRHGIAFARSGFAGLIDEIDLDVGRLGKRNLGRDDRVISHWGREARFPFLDEQFVSWATQTPIWERCGFGTAKATLAPSDAMDEIAESLDPEKKTLRLLALKLGLINTAQEKKRAIQFGSRTAKMESGRSKGTQLI